MGRAPLACRLGPDGKPDKASKTAVTTPPGMMQSFARELTAKWQASNAGNRWAPFRDAIRLYDGATLKLPQAQWPKGKQLLYDAAADTDRHFSDAIQDFLYNWLKPAG